MVMEAGCQPEFGGGIDLLVQEHMLDVPRVQAHHDVAPHNIKLVGVELKLLCPARQALHGAFFQHYRKQMGVAEYREASHRLRGGAPCAREP